MKNYHGEEVEPKVGSYLLVDNWGLGTVVESCEFPDLAKFRIPSVRYDIKSAANITVSGRTLQRRPYSEGLFVRVRIEFVEDGGPSTWHSGWLKAQ